MSLTSLRTFSLVAVVLLQPLAAGAQPAPADPAAPPDAAPAPPAEDANPPAPPDTQREEPAATEGPEASEASDADPVEKHHKKKKKKKHKVHVSGFLQIFYRYTFFTSTDGMVDAPNFRIQRARIAVDGDVNHWLSYDISIDPRAPEITGVLRDAYLTVKHVVPHHRIRIGQQKTLFGYENVESSTRLWAVNRTEVSDNLARGATLRDIGIGILGRWPVNEDFSLEDALSVVNGNGMNSQIDDTRRKSFWGRLGGRYERFGTIVWLGASAATGDFIEPADPTDPVPMASHIKFRRIGGDLELDTRWLWVNAELIWGRDILPGDTSDEVGYYVNAVGKTPYPVGPIFRYDVMGDEFQRFLFGGYYGERTARLRFLVNYEYRRLKDAVRGDDRLYLWTQVRF